jgi:hypothetical protein
MVVMIVMPVVVVIVVVVAVVFVVPMAFMYLPALLIMVVVGMAPVGAGIGWPLPDAGNPDVAAAVHAPVPIDPGVAFPGHGRPYLIAERWWRRADINLDLAECRDCQGGCGDERA